MATAPDQLDVIGAQMAREFQIAFLVMRRFPDVPVAAGMDQRRVRLAAAVLTRDWPTTIRCLNAGRG